MARMKNSLNNVHCDATEFNYLSFLFCFKMKSSLQQNADAFARRSSYRSFVHAQGSTFPKVSRNQNQVILRKVLTFDF